VKQSTTSTRSRFIAFNSYEGTEKPVDFEHPWGVAWPGKILDLLASDVQIGKKTHLDE